MPRPRRNKAKSPEMIAAEKLAARTRAFEAVGIQREAANLPSSETIEITRRGEAREDEQGKKVETDVARRSDAFTALRDGMIVGAYDAARKLEEDIRTRRQETDRGRSMVKVDGGDGQRGEMDVVITAAEKVEAVSKFMGARDWWLLTELIAPTAETKVRFPALLWREIVAHITGETNLHCQGAAVRSACANLVEAYKRAETTTRRGRQRAA